LCFRLKFSCYGIFENMFIAPWIVRTISMVGEKPFKLIIIGYTRASHMHTVSRFRNSTFPERMLPMIGFAFRAADMTRTN